MWYLLRISHYWLDIFSKVALLFSYAVACSCNIIFWRVDYLFAMRINYVFHVEHAAVTYFNAVFTEELVKFVLSKKVFIN